MSKRLSTSRENVFTIPKRLLLNVKNYEPKTKKSTLGDVEKYSRKRVSLFEFKYVFFFLTICAFSLFLSF